MKGFINRRYKGTFIILTLISLILVTVFSVMSYGYQNEALKKDAESGYYNIKFKDPLRNQEESIEVIKKDIPFNNVEFDFSIINKEDYINDGLHYSIDVDADIAEIGQNGILKVKKPSVINIVLTAGEKYELKKHRLVVKAETISNSSFIKFENTEKEYIFGTGNDIISSLKAENLYKNDNGEISYEIVQDDTGLVTSDNIIKIKDKIKFYNYTKKSNIITIRANKEHSLLYGNDYCQYNINIVKNRIPENVLYVSQSDGNEGWYVTPPLVEVNNKYEFSFDIYSDNNMEFYKKYRIYDEGIVEKNIFVRNIITGEIYEPVKIKFKNDFTKPDKNCLNVKFSEGKVKINGNKKTVFFKNFANISVGFKYKSDESEIKQLKWAYVDKNNNSCLRQGVIENFKYEEGFCGSDFNIMSDKENINGELYFKLCDSAGNESDYFTKDIFLVFDNAHPVVRTEIVKEEGSSSSSHNNKKYYNGNINYKIIIDEENFYEEDCNIKFIKDGKPEATDITWSHKGNIHEGNIIINKDGNYLISAEYVSDCSGNITLNENKEAIKIINENFTIDKTPPEFKVIYSKENYRNSGHNYYNQNVNINIIISDENFLINDFKVIIKDSKGKLYNFLPEWHIHEKNSFRCDFVLKNDETYRIRFKCYDAANNVGKEYVSDQIVLDKKKPYVSIKYDRNNKKDIYNKDRKAYILINEKNFNQEFVDFNISEKNVKAGKKGYKISKWEHNGNVHKAAITFTDNGEYNFYLSIKDLCGNEWRKYNSDCFIIDKLPPYKIKADFSESKLREEKSNSIFHYYNNDMYIALRASDNITRVNSFYYKIEQYDKNNKLLKVFKGKISGNDIKYKDKNHYAETFIKLPSNLMNNKSRYNYKIKYAAKDSAGNISDFISNKNRIVIDKTSPIININYDNSFLNEKDVLYFKGSTNINLNVKEENFNPDNISVILNKNGLKSKIVPKWTISKNRRYSANIFLKNDGIYKIKIFCKDKALNSAKPISGKTVIIDSKIKSPEIEIIKDGKNYKPVVNFFDKNLKNYRIRILKRTYMNVYQNISSKLYDKKIFDHNTGIIYFKNLSDKNYDDGKYTVIAEISDKLGHKSKKKFDFIINNHGSVYVYNSYLKTLLNNKNIVKSIKKDIVITEYNPEPLRENTVRIVISKNGTPVIKPVIKKITIDNGKGARWSEHKYVISKKNFKDNGIYKIAVSSIDKSRNESENTFDDKKGICFTVDNAIPEFINITGMEKNIINQKNLLVKYTVSDNIVIKRIEIYCNNKLIGKPICSFGKNKNYYSGRFSLKENKEKQKILIKVWDAAGNLAESDEKNTSHLNFCSEVIVSTNLFVRMMGYKKVFIICIFLIVIAIILVRKLKNKK